VAERTPNTRAIAPDQLREVAPRIIVVRVIVRILELLLVPAVHDGAREFEPVFVAAGGGADGGEIAAAAVLYTLTLA